MSHYESMHPCTDEDTGASAALVSEYLENRYRFEKNDLPALIGLDDVPPIKVQKLDKNIQLKTSDQKRNSNQGPK